MLNILKKTKKINYDEGGGKRNCIKVIQENGKVVINPPYIKKVKIQFMGNDNYLEIWEPCNFWGDGLDIYMQDGCNFVLKKISVGSLAIRGIAQKVYIDEYSTFWSTILTGESSSIKIGKDCAFSGDISVWAADTHMIIDKNDNIINEPSKEGVVIGDHVWIGYGVTILKDSQIASNCIVGAKSIISGQFNNQNSIIVGSGPNLREVKHNVNWDRRTIHEYKSKQKHNNN